MRQPGWSDPAQQRVSVAAPEAASRDGHARQGMTPAPPAPAPPADAVRLDDTVFRSIVDTTHEGVWLIDTEARMLYANDRLAAMLGCAPEALRGQRVPAFVFAEDAPLAAERIGANLRGESEQFDFRLRRADGT